MKTEQIKAWQMTGVKNPLLLADIPFTELGPGEVLIEVAGCGVCHTDLSFWHDGVPVRHALPLTLGHEISGTVVEGSAEWIGKAVVVPAVLPCGDCMLCKNGRSNICRNQLMPGNDFNGGFASHIRIPSKFLCPVPDSLLARFPLAELAVVADAVSTPYQVILKSELQAGDLSIIIGAGGIGLYAVQIAKAKGSKIIVLDISDEKLANAKKCGAEGTVNISDMDIKSVKNAVRKLAAGMGVEEAGWKIFEMSGKKSAQELAFSIITYASTLSIVGFTLEKLELRLSNLMAFDAKVIGTWGCRAELYPEILQFIAEGKLDIKPFIQTLPLSKINEVFQNTLEHKYNKRTILIPDFN